MIAFAMTDPQIDILKTALEWAKAEMFSSAFFALFGLIALAASYGFWQMGKTDMARAYIIPLLVVGILLLILGIGLIIPNQLRLSSFEQAYNSDISAFIAAEMARVEKTINGYHNAIFKGIPVIIIACVFLHLFFRGPVWQASLISIIAMMVIVLIIDTNANQRLIFYKQALTEARETN